MSRPTFLGVDLAWGEPVGRPANESGVVALRRDGRILDAGWCCGVEDVLAWVRAQATDDTLLFVDASLVVENPSGQRPCETEVGRRYGRWKVSANSTNLGSRHLAGVRLLAALEQEGWRYRDGLTGPPPSGRWVAECYSYAALVGAEEL